MKKINNLNFPVVACGSCLCCETRGNVYLLACIRIDNIFQIVNCKDEKTFGDPKVYLPHRVMQNRYLNQDMEWAHEPIEPDEDILMIPTSLDNCHPDAKVIGLYQFTYAWRKHVNK